MGKYIIVWFNWDHKVARREHIKAESYTAARRYATNKLYSSDYWGFNVEIDF